MQSTKENVYKYINWKQGANCNDSRPCQELFTRTPESPQKVFEWFQDDYQGSIVVVYIYLGNYLLVIDYFGSCSGCDEWLDINDGHAGQTICEYTQRMFNDIKVFEGKEEIISHLEKNYIHPECITSIKTNSFIIS